MSPPKLKHGHHIKKHANQVILFVIYLWWLVAWLHQMKDYILVSGRLTFLNQLNMSEIWVKLIWLTRLILELIY